MTLKTIAALCCFAGAAPSVALPSMALAAPVKWTLSGVTFDDGGTVSGSFVYDEDTNTYSAVNVTTSGGSLAPAHYVSAHAAQSDGDGPTLVTSTGAAANAPVLAFYYPLPLSNAGGTATPFTIISGEGQCSSAACTAFVGGALQRRVTGGSMTTIVPIPTLSEWTMIALGVLMAGGAALMLQRRRFAA